MNKDNNENLLILLAQKGDIEAFEKLIQKYQKEIYNLALFKTQNATLAEEIAQETIIRIYKNINKFKFKSSFYTWVYRITYNTLNDLVKKFKPFEEIPLDESVGSVSFNNELENEFHKLELSEKIRYLITKIPHKFQFVLILADIEGKNYQEIAEILKIRIGTVKSRLFRARKILKELIIKEKIEL
ncbi:MAG: sigma-70 family RNA polymerase sigma factor [Elusimicrobiota bacterium]|nr:sigma-70 family RNA polymerase sigma factor [Endomicrobiia bacterium]MDW8166307.1 sigma-70 family RNA polymerase sigma factor [Elusimicrobiota bacterium]